MIPPRTGVTEAILLGPTGAASLRASRFLDLLGVEPFVVSPEAAIDQTAAAGSRCLVLSGADAFLLASEARQRGISPATITARYGALVFHSIDPHGAELVAVSDLLGGVQLSAVLFNAELPSYRVSARHRDECGPLSGLAHGPGRANVDWGLEVAAAGGLVEKLIEINGSGLLTRFNRPAQPVLIASTTEIADLSETITTNIDFRPRFSCIAPLLVALRSVFQTACWTPARALANITIDDPPLWPRYGCLDLRELAEVVDRLGCASTIGMIPWNYQRSKQAIADLFARRAPRLGICYHGCDHTGAEFGLPDEPAMRGLFALAQQRMQRHQALTTLECQPVMIFPQGVFSVEAMQALNAPGCLAVASTESQDHQLRIHLTIGDLMQPALLNFGSLPLFVRRNPSDGPVNFALDLYLGRPCIIVTHHEFFKDGFVSFEETVRAITALDPNLVWDNLQNIVSSCSLRKTGRDGIEVVKIFARQALVVRGPAETTVIMARDRSEPPLRVSVEGVAIGSTTHGLWLTFVLPAQSKGSVHIRVAPAVAAPPAPVPQQAWPVRLRVAARRYASEFRDNHLTKSDTSRRLARRLAGFLRSR